MIASHFLVHLVLGRSSQATRREASSHRANSLAVAITWRPLFGLEIAKETRKDIFIFWLDFVADVSQFIFQYCKFHLSSSARCLPSNNLRST